MGTPDQIKEVYLLPGEVYFGDGPIRIHTLLGSCVAVTLWHPIRRVGGVCHYMLSRRVGGSRGALDGRYANEAMELFMYQLRVRGTRPDEYEVGLFGGGHMFADIRGNAPGPSDVALMNIEAGRELLRQHGFAISQEHVGGAGHRKIVFELWDGRVQVSQHQACATAEPSD